MLRVYRRTMLFVALCLLPLGYAQERTLIVEGLAAPQDGSVATGRSLAIDDALRNAVQQGVGTYLRAETVVENFQLIEDRIVTQTEGYARLLRVLEEGFDHQGLYRLQAEVAVSSVALEQSLRDIIRANGDPRIMIAVREQSMGQSLAPFTVTRLRRELLAMGYSVIESGNVLPDFANPEAVAAQALSFGADLALLVDMQSSANPNPPAVMQGTGLTSANATLSVNVVDMVNSRIVFSDVGNAAGAGGGLEAAAQQALERILPELQTGLLAELGRWIQGAGQSARLYTLQVEGLANYSQAGQVLDTLLSSRSAAGAQLRSFSGGVAMVELDYSGSREGLLAFLSERGWDIIAVVGNTITLLVD